VKYYNHKRPHQGIGGLCPADRYFEIQAELKKTIEHGIQENLLEMALRGKPRMPFYMVGRMEGQSVVLRAEKGKLRLSVDDEEDDNTQEVIYNLNKEGHEYGEDREEQKREEEANDKLRSDGEMSGSSVDLDGAAQASGGMPGVVDPVDGAFAVAETGDGGNAPGTGAEGEPGQRAGFESPFAGNAGEEAPDGHDNRQAGKDTLQSTAGKEIGDADKGPEALRRILAEYM
jgi:hypothetical protein